MLLWSGDFCQSHQPHSNALWRKSLHMRDCLKRVGHGVTAPKRESRLQPVCGRNRLTPGLLGRGPVSQDTRHAVGPTRIIFSDSL